MHMKRLIATKCCDPDVTFPSQFLEHKHEHDPENLHSGPTRHLGQLQ